MIKPTLRQEISLWRKGYQNIIGLDESGRGPLAGPVVAAAVVVLPFFPTRSKGPSFVKAPAVGISPLFPLGRGKTKRGEKEEMVRAAQKISQGIPVRDSKLLTARQREFLYQKLVSHPQIDWGLGIVPVELIDRDNILQATKLAMLKALLDLSVSPDFLLIDGNFLLSGGTGRCPVPTTQKAIINGDQKVFSIACASIIAKVTRDQIMRDLDKLYPHYGFNRHKGYGTRLHFARLAQYGPCQEHRRTFHPVSDWV